MDASVHGFGSLLEKGEASEIREGEREEHREQMKRRQGRKGAGRGRRHDLLLLLSPAAWTRRRRGGAGAHDHLGIEQRREEEARPQALVGGRRIWEDPEVGSECGGGGGGDKCPRF